MILKKWDDLPENLKNEDVKKYYDILSKKKVSLFLKRLFDLFFSLTIMIVLLPFFIIVAIAIKLDSKGTVFYRHERITTYGKTFKIFKFRTMVQNADKMGTLVTIGHDKRITRVGKIIRRIRLDEIPQLINVLKGEMTFVGTRPEVKKYVDCYTDEMKSTLLMPAGVTSIASIKYKDEDKILERATKEGKDTDTTYITEVLPQKMQYNLKYIAKFSIWYDFKTCIETVINVLR